MTLISREQIASANGIEIAYEEFGRPDGEPLLLVAGLGMQLLAWDVDFCRLLTEQGFRVIRFDNRDIGHSSKIWVEKTPRHIDLYLGRRATAPYLLSDMADDIAGLLDHLEISATHIAGTSLGAMVAQTLAIERPERVRSMVSMMSTTGNRMHGIPTLRGLKAIFRPHGEGREAVIESNIQMYAKIGSPEYPIDMARLRHMVTASYDRDNRRDGIARQMHAVFASGDRTAGLQRLYLPTTVIHGAADPIMRPIAGRATADAVPGARLRMISGMGHDMPSQLWKLFAEEISSTATCA
jgi:pimeloyl-ACP methyl ester carboxylesterase